MAHTPERFGEQLSRVREMACGSPTWDLSDADIAALSAVLKSHSDLYDALKFAHAGCATLRADGTCDGCFVSAALLKAEGR